MNAVILVLVCHSVLESVAVDVDRDVLYYENMNTSYF